MVPGTTGRTTPGSSCWIATYHSTSPAYRESSPTLIPDRSNCLYILRDLPYGHGAAITVASYPGARTRLRSQHSIDLLLIAKFAHVIKSYSLVPFPDAGKSGIVTETKMGVAIVDTHTTQKATKEHEPHRSFEQHGGVEPR